MVNQAYANNHGLVEYLYDNGDGTYSKAVAAHPSNTFVSVDVTSAPVAITPHDVTTFTPGNRVIIEVSVAGNIKVGWPNGVTSTHSFPTPGTYQYNWAINQVFVTGSTATFTSWKAS